MSPAAALGLLRGSLNSFLRVSGHKRAHLVAFGGRISFSHGVP